MNKKIKIILKAFLLLLIISFIIIRILFYPKSPRVFYDRHKLMLNKIRINISKDIPKKNIPGISNVGYYETYSKKMKSKISFIEISLKYKLLSGPPFYKGLIYSYDGEPHISFIPDSYLSKISDKTWEYKSESGDYIRIEHLEDNWFMYECEF